MKKVIFVIVFAITLAWPCKLFGQEIGKSAFKSVTFLSLEKKTSAPKITNWLGFSPTKTYTSEVIESTHVPEFRSSNINWKGLLTGSLTFLAAEHGVRLMNPRVRANLGGNWVYDWKKSVQSIHGFNDGDSWTVNYGAHAGQGAVSMAICARNDRKSQNVKVGLNREYAIAKGRQALCAFAYSEWFEMGPFLSETSTGNLGYQYGHNAYGDQVITPLTGLAVSILEDVLYVKVILKKAETDQRQANKLVIFLNPFRAVANILSFTYPWRGITLR
jgi:hypothetical protein